MSLEFCKVEKLYQSHGWCTISWEAIVMRLSNAFPDLLTLSGNGIANTLIFHSQASYQLSVSAADCDDDLEFFIKKVAKVIANECTAVKRDTSTVWPDQYIESTFMRYGHGPEGITGMTLEPGALNLWALGL